MERKFDEVMQYIKDFLDNTPDDIYDFSCDLEGMLVIHYDEMYKEQPNATKILNNEVPDICATLEPGFRPVWRLCETLRKVRKDREVEIDVCILRIHDKPKPDRDWRGLFDL